MSATIAEVGDLLTKEQQELLIGYKIDQARENYRYLADHPEIKKFINMLLKAVLYEQPQKVRQFLYDYIQDNFIDIKNLFEPDLMSAETGDPRHSIMMMRKWRNKYKLRHSFKVPHLSTAGDHSTISTESIAPTITKVIGDFGFYESHIKQFPEEKLIKMKGRSDRIRGDHQTRPRFLSEAKSTDCGGVLKATLQALKLSRITTGSDGRSKSASSYPKPCIVHGRRELSMFSQNYSGRTESDVILNRVSGIAVKKNIPDFGFYGDLMKRKAAEEKRLQDEYIMEHMVSTRETF